MEDILWKKDVTPYLVFPCSKCRQYTYVKTTQKSKKCARCGRMHIVDNILDSGEIVNGISNAVELVKQKQDEFALNELGSKPEFRTPGDFMVATDIEPKRIAENEKPDHDYEQQFTQMLLDLSISHKNFPYYVIEIMADNYCIPQSELKLLTRQLLKRGKLRLLKDGTYQVRFKLEDC
jgi:hypothetical protein